MIVCDWDQKREVTRIVLGLLRCNDIIDDVVDEKFLNRCGFTYDNLQDHIANRWHRNDRPLAKNSKYRRFFAALSELLSCNESVPGAVIANGTITEFINCLPVSSRATLIRAIKEKHPIDEKYFDALHAVLKHAGYFPVAEVTPVESSFHVSSSDDLMVDRYFPVWTGISTSPLRLVSDGLKLKTIDQSFYYQYPESAARWFAITNNGQYEGFDKCKMTLAQLTFSREWKQFINQTSFEGVAMLGGGGSPSKDVILLKSLANNIRSKANKDKPIKYTLLDTSYYMLVTSQQAIEHEIHDWPGRDNLEIRSIVSDMMKLNHRGKMLRGDGHVAWFITGGTIGNVDEAQFFDSVASQARDGDWLIVGAHLVEDRDGFLEDLESEYRQNEVQQLVKMPLKGVLAELDFPDPAKMALEVQIKALPEEMNNHSSVPGSVSVEATINLEGVGEVLLFKSSRYREEELIRLASQSGLSHVTSIAGPDHTFKQIVFQYQDSCTESG